ncbi:MAG TPA: hypothetical protein VFP65_08380 [Anaeromyxobacteraceae bacterium]|nr:hypothetical protein [Anaeromyxobacteraceae bacterium]
MTGVAQQVLLDPLAVVVHHLGLSKDRVGQVSPRCESARVPLHDVPDAYRPPDVTLVRSFEGLRREAPTSAAVRGARAKPVGVATHGSRACQGSRPGDDRRQM